MQKIIWRSETKKISELNPATYNPRQLTKKQAEDLGKSLDKFSLAEPIVINLNNTIIGGHQRITLLKLKGVLEVDVRVPSRELNIEEEQELNLRLNRNLGEWDFDALANLSEDLLKEVGFESDELDKIFELGENEEEQDIPSVPKEPKSKKGKIYQLNNHRLMCGNSLEASDVALLMNGNKANIVFTDPPYGVSYSKKNEFLNQFDKGNRIQNAIENDNVNEEDIKVFWKKSFEIIRDNLADINSYYIFGPQIQGMMMMMMMMMMEAGLPYRHVIIWVKNNHVLGRCDYNYKHEPLFFGWTKTHKFYRGGQFLTSVWEVDKPLKNDLHPTMKPIELAINALLNSSDREGICLDPFSGSGSTLIACEKTERICYAMEIDLGYCDVIIERWCRLVGKNPEDIYAQ